MYLPTISAMRVERAEQAGQSTTWLQLTLEDGTRLKAPAFSVAELGAFAGKELTCEELAQLKAEAAKAAETAAPASEDK